MGIQKKNLDEFECGRYLKLSNLEFLLLACKQPQKKQPACTADFGPSAAQLPFQGG